MPKIASQLTISLDGFVAGPEQSLDTPMGVGGERLHGWFRSVITEGEDEPDPVDVEVAGEVLGYGAYVMGRNMFGGGHGPWDPDWRGWWGDEPPYHAPVFVLTSQAREPLPMAGGTTFHFVTGGVEEAVARARQAAGDGDVCVAGGAATVQQAMNAGLPEELFLHVSPVLLGAGERLFDGVTGASFAPVQVRASPLATHIRYAVSYG